MTNSEFGKFDKSSGIKSASANVSDIKHKIIIVVEELVKRILLI